MKWLYLALNLFTISFPLIRSFEPRIAYATKWKWLWPAIALTGSFFIIWDILFTKHGVWGFNPTYLIGIEFLGLPIEEWMFFITVPFASMFIYECVNYFLPKIRTTPTVQYLSIVLGIALIIMSLIYQNKAYTFWNFLFGGSMLTFVGIRSPRWLGAFWVTYLFHLIPFVLVNGILTGSFIEDQVVWYNDTENLGIRLFTIPVEDSIYSLLLLLMNVVIFESLKKRQTS